MMPTVLARSRSRNVPKVLRVFLMTLDFDVAEAGVLDRKLGQHARVLGLVDRPRQCRHRLVDPLLSARLYLGGVNRHCGPGPGNDAADHRSDLVRRIGGFLERGGGILHRAISVER